DDRAAVLAALECVSHVCIFSGASVESLVAALAPDVLVKGGDYAPAAIVGREHVEARGGQVRALPLWPDLSTTQLIERIKALPSA
ncbi:MAG: D-glycero-beta-D-manno-heptose 1-phosphate adenylyltransferase, partial [Gemmatimonadota bacterium]|nr:D-glycero-beta-D-manno-heptose 1-phosphate adenylyltransferase [Gemmatimonadota bacterium]